MDSHFKKLLKKLRLKDPQKKDAKTKVKSVCETLHAKYYPNHTYDGRTKFLVGSYGKHTNIRPPKDIDVIFKMPDDAFQRFDSLSGNKQSQLLQEVRVALKDKFSTTEKISAFGKVIVVGFSEGTHTVEVLPGWQLPSGAFRIPNTENGGSWEEWNPLAEEKNITDSSKATGKTRSLIRILKSWTVTCSVPIKSFILEILVVDYLREQHQNQVNVLYPELVLGFFKYLKGKRNGMVISSASGKAINLGDVWFSKAETAVIRAEKANEFEAKGKLRDASVEWKKVFGDDFPIAEDEKEAAVIEASLDIKIAQLTRTYPSPDEEHITRTHNVPVQLVDGYRVSIDAEVTQNGFRTGLLSSFLARRFPLLKGKKLLFTVTRSNVPTPYNVMWKVRNFGDEARDANGLRGEITHDRGARQKEERTLYHGEHYVECYVIKDDVCVAVGKILVPIGNTYE